MTFGSDDDYDEEYDDSAMKRTLISVGATIAVSLVLLGIFAWWSSSTSTTRFATSAIAMDGVTQLAIRSGESDVTLIEGRGSEVVVRAEVTGGWRDTAYELRRRGDEIEVIGQCRTWFISGCGVKVRIEVPPGLPLLVATDDADVHLEGLVDHVLSVATDAGDITGRGLGVADLTVKTGSGDVDARFTRQPFAIKGTSDSGDLRVEVPEGAITYSLTTKTKSGDVNSDFDSDTDGRGFLRLTTSTGDIWIVAQ